MPIQRSTAVNRAIDKLFEMGALKENVLEELGELLRRLDSISNGLGAAPASRRRATRKKVAKTRGKARKGKRSRRGRVEITKNQLVGVMGQGMTTEQIADTFNTSVQTVYNKKKKFGLVKTRAGGKGRKKPGKVAKKTARKKTAAKKTTRKIGKKTAKRGRKKAKK